MWFGIVYVIGLIASLIGAVYFSRDANGDLDTGEASFYAVLSVAWPVTLFFVAVFTFALLITNVMVWLVKKIDAVLPNKAKENHSN